VSNSNVFAGIASRYDRINRILSLGRDGAWRRTAIARLPTGRVLDLGGGTGAANGDLADRHIVALDPAPEMLALNRDADRVVGVGERLPFADGSFDAVFSAFVLRNLDSVPDTLAEIARVLRRGGRAGIVDLGRPLRPASARLHRTATRMLLPVVGRLVGAADEYRYLHDSLDKLPRPEAMFAPGPLIVEDVWRMGPLGFVYGALLVKP